MAVPIFLRLNPRLSQLEPAPEPVFAAWDRVAMTVLCRDCDDLPKVERAGEVETLADGTRVQILHNGLKVIEGGYGGTWTTELIRRLRGHHEPQEEKVFAALLERLRGEAAPRMIEIGSFWAFYSLWFRQVFPAGRTLLLEPDPGNLALGLRNFELNGFKTAWLRSGAGSYCGDFDFFAESDGIRRKTPTTTVDALIDKLGIPRIDLLHCDAQGIELEVLKGAERTIAAGQLRFLVISTHHHQIAGDPLLHHRCLEHLQGLGAQVIAEHSVAESYSGDGLIVASLSPSDHGFTVPISRNVPSSSLFRETEFDLAEAEERCRQLAAENEELRARLGERRR